MNILNLYEHLQLKSYIITEGGFAKTLGKGK